MTVTNAGVIGVGSTPWLITIAAVDGVANSGNYTQTATGRLNMFLGPTSTSRLTIANEVNLAGTLDVTLVGGYQHPQGQATTYTLLTFASRPNPQANRFTTEPDGYVSNYGALTMSITYNP